MMSACWLRSDAVCAICPADAAISSELAVISAVMRRRSRWPTLERRRETSKLVDHRRDAASETADLVVAADLVDLLRQIACGDGLGGDRELAAPGR